MECPTIGGYFNESLALLSLAKQGQGVAFLPEVYVQKELANGTLSRSVERV
ncbi:LysR substrate-binding domain-containing protein [Paraglaciecola sp. Hal342]